MDTAAPPNPALTPAAAAGANGYSFWTVFLSGVALNLWAAVPWTVVFLFIRWSGLRLYVLSDKEVCRRIQRRVTATSHISDNGRGYGYTYGYWYLMDISVTNYDGDIRYDLWMIATVASFEALTADTRDVRPKLVTHAPAAADDEEAEEEEEEEAKPLALYERAGSYNNLYYRQRKVLGGFKPRDQQSAIVAQITALMKTKGHAVVYLHGPPGSGKSMIGVLLAQALGGSYCNTHKPWQPGDPLGALHSEAEPSAERPLVVAFDEFDGPLVAIHSRTLAPHKNIPTAVGDKEGWNRMLDEIGRGLYPHIVLLLTSNRDPEFIRSLDPSYIREGRIDLTLAVKVDDAAALVTDDE
jgi:hypothetical protein